MPSPENELLVALEARREENSKKEKVRNQDLYAGSPMYYYCSGCNAEQVLPEDHLASEIKLVCDDCKELVDTGVMTAEQLREGNH